MFCFLDLPQHFCDQNHVVGLPFVFPMTTQWVRTKWHFPEVNADSMWNISDALGIDLTIEDVQVRILQRGTRSLDTLEENRLIHLQFPKSTYERLKQ